MQARKDDDGWVINGKKHVVVNAPIADIFLVLAYIDPDAGHEQGMSFFLIEKDSPGLVVGQALETMGMRGVPLASLELKDCACREVLGGIAGKGFEQCALDAGPSSPLSVHGRGLQLIKGVMDDIDIDTCQDGTSIRMVKHKR